MTTFVNLGASASDASSLTQVTDVFYLNNSGEWRTVAGMWLNEATATANLSSLTPMYLQPETEAHIAQMNTTPDVRLQHDLNLMIAQLKERELWERMDILSVAQGPDPRDALLNIREPGENNAQLTDGTATLAYTADVGLKMNQSASGHLWIDTSELSLSRYSNIDAHAWVYEMTANTDGNVGAGTQWPSITLEESATPVSNKAMIEIGPAGKGQYPANRIFCIAQETSAGGATSDLYGNDYSAGMAPGFVGFGAYSAQHRSYINVGINGARVGGKITVGGPVGYNLGTKRILVGGRHLIWTNDIGGIYEAKHFNHDGIIGGWGIGSRMNYSDLSAVADIINNYFTRRGTNRW